MDEEVPSGSDNIVTEFNTYEDFLDSQITSFDLYYLEVFCCLSCFVELTAQTDGLSSSCVTDCTAQIAFLLLLLLLLKLMDQIR